MAVSGLHKTSVYSFSIEFNIPTIFRWALHCCRPEGASITVGVVHVENLDGGQLPIVGPLEGISKEWFSQMEEMFYLFLKTPLLGLMVKFT